MTIVEDLRRHLVEARLAGRVATPAASVVANCRRFAAGDPDHTFGLSDWHTTSAEEALAAVHRICGEADPDPEGRAYIDPDATLAAIRRQAELLAAAARRPGRVLAATGHPTGLLAHYAELLRALQRHGWQVLTPLDSERLATVEDGWRGVRYVAGVGCLWSGADLLHTHRADYMEVLLDAAEEAGTRPDLVLGDHGMAGAAIERGIPTLSIADVNDPALFVAQVHGRTDAVLPIDDNLPPRLFTPVTAAICAGL